MTKHVNNICKTAFYHLRNIAHVRKFLNVDATVSLVYSLISSRLDYCNCLLYGASKQNLDKMQRVQNNAARLVCRKRKFDHITSTLYSLHWLPVKYRIEYKILLLTFKALHDMAPVYIKDLLRFYVPTRKNMRSANNVMSLQVPKAKLVTAGDACFSVAAPKLWNGIPNSLKILESLEAFKTHLKTYLFRLAYSNNIC